MRIFVDLDGTLAVWRTSAKQEDLYRKGYFASLPPQDNVLQAVERLAEEYPVYILSAYLEDSGYALTEKNDWIDKYLPLVPTERRVFVPCGEEKYSYVPGGVRPDDVLLDDYTINLLGWVKQSGIGVKLLNGVNNTRGTWYGAKVSKESAPHEIASTIKCAMI